MGLICGLGHPWRMLSERGKEFDVKKFSGGVWWKLGSIRWICLNHLLQTDRPQTPTEQGENPQTMNVLKAGWDRTKEGMSGTNPPLPSVSFLCFRFALTPGSFEACMETNPIIFCCLIPRKSFSFQMWTCCSWNFHCLDGQTSRPQNHGIVTAGKDL